MNSVATLKASISSLIRAAALEGLSILGLSGGATYNNKKMAEALDLIADYACPLVPLVATATLDFPSCLTNIGADLTIAVPGAVVGNAVALGTPAAPDANTCYTAFVSAADVVTVRFNNYSGGTVNPGSGSFTVIVLQ